MGFSGSLEKMMVIAYQKSDFTSEVGRYVVYINPASYSHTFCVKYNDVQAQGSSGGSSEFNRIPPDTVELELVFDGTGVVPSPLPGLMPFTEDGIAEQVAKFKNLVFTYNGNIHSPNYLKLSWGTFLFKCKLSKLSMSYTLFKPDGTPLRARAKGTFLGYNDEVELALKARMNSPDLTHVRTVQAGDTLPLMCYRIYGTSTPYVDVARVNGLSDFRQLTVGTQLLFPPLREALE
ncbi:tail protein X [Myxococcus sp. K15C18031901]|uniref:CIS tube protein n=1 Tax=Myxococcus dinghuensis TaxID=2906761 RepID=UPI0020A7F83E|nr:tail protein X [Myxococcus dinghuensis]MCP3100286.1 tail protein X [Myxococcus dinghuensis]